MATFTIIVTPGYDFPPGVAVGLDELRAGAKPTITINAKSTDLDDFSPVAATVTGQALVWNATTGKWEPSGTIQVRRGDMQAFQGATAAVSGISGAVPAPAPGNVNQFLRGDGMWATPAVATGGFDIFNYQNFI